jgi:hypothetical protein
MAVSNLVAASAGGIKSVQRGLASSSGNVTITAVDTNKSFVTVFGTASSGTVAASGSINAANGTQTNSIMATWVSGLGGWQAPNTQTAILTASSVIGGENNPRGVSVPGTTALNSTNISGGSNNLVSAVVQGFLANSTTLTVSGACRWEVVEFN